MDEQEQAAFGGAAVRMGELAAEGRSTAAARAFAGSALQRRRDRHGRGRGLLRGRRTLRPEPAPTSSSNGGNTKAQPLTKLLCLGGATSAPALVLHGADTTPLSIRQRAVRG